MWCIYKNRNHAEWGARIPKEGCMFDVHDVKATNADVIQGCHTSCQPYR